MRLLIVFSLYFLSLVSVYGRQSTPVDVPELRELLGKGTRQLQAFMYGSKRLISKEQLLQAKAVIYMDSFLAGVGPASLKKARGFAVLLQDGKPQEQAPIFLRENSLGLGLQLGAKNASSIWLLMDDSALRLLEGRKVKSGMDYGAVIGTVGQNHAQHLEGRHPPFYFYSSAKGLCVGGSLEAGHFKDWEEANALTSPGKASLSAMLYASGKASPAAAPLVTYLQEAFEGLLTENKSGWHTAYRGDSGEVKGPRGACAP